MIRHIVLWRFLEEAGGRGKGENLLMARTLLRGLRETVPGMIEWEVEIVSGGGEQMADLSLNSTFPDFETLKAYQDHPDHTAVVKFLREVQIGKTVADYSL